MAILNITYQGVSVDYSRDLDENLSDADIRRIAIEVIRAGEVPSLNLQEVGDRAFMYFVVDRFDTPEGGKRLYLRPKVPFGVI
ncbi:MAG: hypothetical protein JJE04_19590 [Acidobacteriia bacterium]|nr:hypothetical protein [Terriglobia bacterium]